MRGARQRVFGIRWEIYGILMAGVHLLRHTFCSHLATKGAPALKTVEISWKRTRLDREVIDSPELSGAGYGDRTRLAGLGSQNITTMLSPPADRFA